MEYNRSFAITFHDRDISPESYDACYSNRPEYTHCPSVALNWTTEETSNDQCLTAVTGHIPFSEAMMSNYFDQDLINIQSSNQTYALNGYNQNVWDLYMVAMIETWSGIYTQPSNENGTSLVIDRERYSMYYIPFRLRFPQQIELVQGLDESQYSGGVIEGERVSFEITLSGVDLNNCASLEDAVKRGISAATGVPVSRIDVVITCTGLRRRLTDVTIQAIFNTEDGQTLTDLQAILDAIPDANVISAIEAELANDGVTGVTVTSVGETSVVETSLFPNIVGVEVSLAFEFSVLYAIIEQRTLDINFNPANGQPFATANIVLKTQVNFPIGLRNYTDPIAPAVIRHTAGDIASVQFTSATHLMSCAGVVQAEENCEQEWNIEIILNQCDISGNFEAEFHAECFDFSDGCGLDVDTGEVTSNGYSGVLRFSIVAQSFCPTVIDEISVSASISKFVDSDFSDVANPGTNLFINDHVFYEVNFQTSSIKMDNSLQGDVNDTIIDFVRARRIVMTVTLSQSPLQTTVDQTSTDVTLNSELNYEVVLCDVPALSYPYLDTLDDSNNCFKNLGYNAEQYMDFMEYNETSSSGAIQANEIGFSFRLDERVIPVDLPNSENGASIDIDIWAEVYYRGVNNPSRRRLRRSLQARDQEQREVVVRDEFRIKPMPQYSFCYTDVMNHENVGFLLDVEMRHADLPDMHSPLADLHDSVHHLARYLRVRTTEVKMVKAMICSSEDNCFEIYPNNEGLPSTSLFRMVRYFIDIPSRVALTFQQDLYYGARELFEECEFFRGKTLRTYSIDQCDSDLMTIFDDSRNALDVDIVYVPSESISFSFP